MNDASFRLPEPLRRPRSAVVIAAAVLLLSPARGTFAAQAAGQDYFAAGRSIELLGDVYREVTENYVDRVDVGQLRFAGIDGMLGQLDPYTTFMDESQSEELDEITSGQYAGIGITIAPVSGDLYIMSVIEGNAASRAGIRLGDRIVEVNGVNVKKRPLDEVRNMIKGDAGSTVRLGITRSGVSGVLDYTLTRSEVRVSTISYSGLFGSIGYVGMESFGERTAEELRDALKAMQRQAESRRTPLGGVVLDLRGNPGGLLSSAVDVAGEFLVKGSKVVSTRGQADKTGQAYLTRSAPMVPSLPLAVLIDGDSASASEIVAGAIQELDRGLIIGEGSFGKGLVQSVIPLPYDHSLKLTTSKYYTPSGRLIQKPIVRDDTSRAVVVGAAGIDSTRVFYTANRRKVFGGGGIRPDVVVRARERSDYEHALDGKGLFFRFANRYRAEHERLNREDIRGARLVGAFKRYVEKEGFSFRSQPRKMIDSLKAQVKSAYGADGNRLASDLENLDRSLASLDMKKIASDSLNIAASVRHEVMRHYDEQSARRSVIEEDPVALKAFSLLADPAGYRRLLRP